MKASGPSDPGLQGLEVIGHRGQVYLNYSVVSKEWVAIQHAPLVSRPKRSWK